MIKLKYNGHANICLSKDNTTILIDPFFTDNPVNKTNPEEVTCNYILVSHAHFDHIGDSIEIAKYDEGDVQVNATVLVHGFVRKDRLTFANDLKANDLIHVVNQ